jgi:hypothetical protein
VDWFISFAIVAFNLPTISIPNNSEFWNNQLLLDFKCGFVFYLFHADFDLSNSNFETGF